MSKYLQELRTHPGWEDLKKRCIGPRDDESQSWKDQLQVKQNTALRNKDYDKAQYYLGQIELLEQMFRSDLIDRWLKGE